MKVLIFTFTCLFFSGVARGEDFKDTAKEFYNTFREIKKSGGFEVIKLSEDKKPDSGLCVSCGAISGFVGEVNNIVSKLAEEENKKDSSKRTIEVVAGLDALYHYTLRQKTFSGKIECDRFLDTDLKGYDEDVSLDDAVVMISKEIPLSKINAVHISDGRKRTYFYRGKGRDQNIIVRIDIHDRENVNVTYYKIKNSTPRIVQKKNNKIKKAKSKKVKKWEVWADSSEDEESTSEDRVDYGVGFSIEHRHNIPKKLTLIKGTSYTTLGDSFALKTSTEVSTKKQQFTMSLSSREGGDYATIEVDEDLAEINFPSQIELLDSGLNLDTVFSVNTDNEKKVKLSLKGEEGSSTSIILQQDNRGNSGILNRTQQLSSSQRVSFQVKANEDGKNEAWVRYKLTF